MRPGADIDPGLCFVGLGEVVLFSILPLIDFEPATWRNFGIFFVSIYIY